LEDEMRKLNKEQKRLLDSWYERKKDNIGFSFEMKDLDYRTYKYMAVLNDFETLYQEVTNYIQEKLFEENK